MMNHFTISGRTFGLHGSVRYTFVFNFHVMTCDNLHVFGGYAMIKFCDKRDFAEIRDKVPFENVYNFFFVSIFIIFICTMKLKLK